MSADKMATRSAHLGAAHTLPRKLLPQIYLRSHKRKGESIVKEMGDNFKLHMILIKCERECELGSRVEIHVQTYKPPTTKDATVIQRILRNS